jgi:hypothetical protein
MITSTMQGMNNIKFIKLHIFVRYLYGRESVSLTIRGKKEQGFEGGI